MIEENKASTEDNTPAPEENSSVNEESPLEKAKTINEADHARALADMKKYKAETAALRKQIEAEKMKKLEDEKQWEEIARLNQEKAEKAEAEKQQTQAAFADSQKLTAIKSAAKDAGITPSAMRHIEKMIDLDDIEFETTSRGNVNIIGAEEAIKKFKTLNPDFFGKAIPTIQGKTPMVTGQAAVTKEGLRKIREAYNRSGSKQDLAAYEKASAAYTAQLRNK